MSTKTQKLTSSRENVIIRTRRTTAIIPNNNNHNVVNDNVELSPQPQQSITSPILSPEHRRPNLTNNRVHLQNGFNNRNSIYPVIATIIVGMILYGFYTSSFQPTPVNSIQSGYPLGNKLVEFINGHVQHWYQLWKHRFEDMKEPIGGSIRYEKVEKEKEIEEKNAKELENKKSLKERVVFGPSYYPNVRTSQPRVEESTIEDHALDWEHITLSDPEFLKPHTLDIELDKKLEFIKPLENEFENQVKKEKENIENIQKESIDSIQKEVKEILEVADKYRLAFYDQWKDKKDFTFKDLQQLKYQLRDGYRETRDALYRKSKDGEKLLESIYRP